MISVDSLLVFVVISYSRICVENGRYVEGNKSDESDYLQFCIAIEYKISKIK